MFFFYSGTSLSTNYGKISFNEVFFTQLIETVEKAYNNDEGF